MAEDQPPVSGAESPLSDSGQPIDVNAPGAEFPVSDTVASAIADAASEPLDTGNQIDKATIDELLRQASFEDPTQAASGDAAPAPEPGELKLPNFEKVMAEAQVSSIALLRDVDLNVKIELGRSRMLVEDVLKLSEGSVVELDKLAGDPVDVFVNDRLVARGEVLVLNDNFCVRINEIVVGEKEEGL
jgi:flagellar motor switch protein FliN